MWLLAAAVTLTLCIFKTDDKKKKKKKRKDRRKNKHTPSSVLNVGIIRTTSFDFWSEPSR